MEKHLEKGRQSTKEIETSDPHMSDVDYRALEEIRRLVLEKKVSIEVGMSAIGTERVIIRRNDEIIFSTDLPDEIAEIKEFLKDPQKARNTRLVRFFEAMISLEKLQMETKEE